MDEKRELKVGDAFVTTAAAGLAGAWIIISHKKDVSTKGIYFFSIGNSTTITLNKTLDHEDVLSLTGRTKSEYRIVNNRKRLSLLFDMVFAEELTINKG